MFFLPFIFNWSFKIWNYIKINCMKVRKNNNAPSASHLPESSWFHHYLFSWRTEYRLYWAYITCYCSYLTSFLQSPPCLVFVEIFPGWPRPRVVGAPSIIVSPESGAHHGELDPFIFDLSKNLRIMVFITDCILWGAPGRDATSNQRMIFRGSL